MSRWLVVEPGRIGDWVVATPAVRTLRERLGCEIDWCVRQEVVPLLHLGIPFGKVIAIPSRMSVRGALKLALDLMGARNDYEGTCVLSPARTGRLATWAVRARRRIGYVAGKGCLEGWSLDGNPIRYVPSLEPLRLRAFKVMASGASGAQYPPTLAVTPESKTAIVRLLAEKQLTARRFVVFSTGSRGTTRQWPLEGWAALGREIAGWGVPVVLSPGPNDESSARLLEEAIASPLVRRLNVLPLDMYCSLLTETAVLVGLDSGPMHLAAALGTRVVALYGPSNPTLTAPHVDSSRLRVVRCPQPLPCQPCVDMTTALIGKLACGKTLCPCMSALDPKSVACAVRDLLGSIPT